MKKWRNISPLFQITFLQAFRSFFHKIAGTQMLIISLLIQTELSMAPQIRAPEKTLQKFVGNIIGVVHIAVSPLVFLYCTIYRLTFASCSFLCLMTSSVDVRLELCRLHPPNPNGNPTDSESGRRLNPTGFKVAGIFLFSVHLKVARLKFHNQRNH